MYARMRKNIINNITLLASMATLVGCSSDTDITVPDSEKHAISLSVGVESPMTRAVVTNGDNKTLEVLPVGTGLSMVMKSEYSALADDGLNYKGTDKAVVKYCTSFGTAQATSTTENPVEITGTNIRYWEDAHARSSKLSVWAVAVPSVTTDKWHSSVTGWGSTEQATTIDWTISNAQTSTTIGNEDLCFSNNIAGDNTMRYSNQQSLKFDQGKLIFYHALSKITVKLVPGDGFKKDGTDFKFDGTSASGYAPVTMKGFNLKGTFNVANGEFSSTSSNGDITSMGVVSTSNTDGYVLSSLVMPGTSLGNSTNTALEFSFDGNAYTVSSETIAASLRSALGQGAGTDVTLEAGKNYILKFTINKTGIKLVATIGAWQDVEGTSYSPLININYAYGHTGTEFAKGFSFYMKETSETNFTKGTDVTYDASAEAPARNYSLTTPLYWPNHNTHYYFRGIYPTVGATNGTPEGNVTNTTVTVSNAAYSSGTFPSDLMIGYPRTENDAAADETCKTHSLAGICATEGDIRMNFLYAMSQVEVILKSELETDMPETAKVTLNGNSGVDILNGYTSGSIALMTGVATGTGDKAIWPMAGGVYNSETQQYDVNNAIVPQSLTGLKFRIKVEGGNGTFDYYEATIADILVGGSTITEWEPGKHYTYTLNITKTGIKITATLKDWETVTSDNNHIWM